MIDNNNDNNNNNNNNDKTVSSIMSGRSNFFIQLCVGHFCLCVKISLFKF